jgi:tetratricopeptide (TPR) repeat protein
MGRAFYLGLLCAALAGAQDAPPEQLFGRALEAQQRGDFAQAASLYGELVKAQPGFFGAWANLGVTLVRLGRFDEAVEAYRTALKLDSSNAPLRMNLALAFYKKGDVRHTAEELEILRKADDRDPRADTLLGDCYSKLGEYEHALAVVEPASRAHPDDLDLAYVTGAALIATGRNRDGIARVQRVAEARRSAEAYLLAGKTWLKIGEPDKAVKDLEAAAAIDPALPGIYTLRGVAREGSFDTAGAESDLRKALELNPNDLEALVHLGAILYTRRELAESKTYLDRALKIDPDSQFAIYEMALWKSASGQVEAAVRDLEKVVGRDPGWLQAHIQLAALYYRLNRPQDGLKERQIVDRLTAEQQKAESSLVRPH